MTPAHLLALAGAFLIIAGASGYRLRGTRESNTSPRTPHRAIIPRHYRS